MNPYHIFEVQGEHFVFDTTGYRFYHIEKVMYQFLSLCRNSGIDGALSEMLAMGEYSKKLLKDISKTVRTLSKNGLFDYPSADVSDEKIADEVAQDEKLPLTIMDLYVTDSCNLACRYCFCETGRDHVYFGNMKKETAEKAIHMLIENSGKSPEIHVVFLGGEPLLNFGLLQYVVSYGRQKEEAVGKKISFSMTTNGTLITDEIASYLCENDIGTMVSLDGPAEHHNIQCPMRCGGDSFVAAAKGIKCLVKHGMIPEIRTTLGHPVPTLNELKQLYQSLGEFRRIVIEPARNCIDSPSPVDLTEYEFDEWLSQEEDELNELVSRFRENNRDAPPFFPYQGYINNMVSNRPFAIYYSCGAGTMRCTVDAQGNIFPCALFSGLTKWKIGDVYSGLNKKRCADLWRQYATAVRGKCHTCWAYVICRPASPCDLAKTDGTLADEHRFCRHKKTRIERAAYLYHMSRNPDRHNAGEEHTKEES